LNFEINERFDTKVASARELQLIQLCLRVSRELKYGNRHRLDGVSLISQNSDTLFGEVPVLAGITDNIFDSGEFTASSQDRAQRGVVISVTYFDCIRMEGFLLYKMYPRGRSKFSNSLNLLMTSGKSVWRSKT